MMNDLAERLERRVRHLADTIGPRHYRRPDALLATRDYITRELEAEGLTPSTQRFVAAGMSFFNIEVVIPSTEPLASGPCIVIGAHYDTVPGTPGADDNGTAVAALLEFARRLGQRRLGQELRLVFFPNEEPPFFPNAGMGSAAYAKQLAADDVRVRFMISLEMLGYYRDEPSSQKYPPGLGPFYPDRGNFIGFVGNLKSRKVIKEFKRVFRMVSDFPCESLAAPEWTTVVGLSDHYSFWSEGYEAFMVTDTAFMRNPHYHQPTDTPDTLDFARFAMVTEGLINAVARLADTR